MKGLRNLAVVMLVMPSLMTKTSVRAQAQAQAPAGGFSVANLDRSADACVDFFQFACGNWIRNNPVPRDQPEWGTFNELADRNRNTLRAILDDAVAASDRASASDRMLADFYGTCMDEKAIEAQGKAPLLPMLARVDAMKSKDELPAVVAALHAEGVSAFFGFGVLQDLKDATRMLAIHGQGGLGLPDRDYYFRDDTKAKEQREAYVAHVARLLTLAGEPAEDAAKSAATVMAIETGLAKNALDATSQRDPNKLYHLMKAAEFAALSPAFDNLAYLRALKAPEVIELNVSEPEFLKGMSALIASQSLESLKAYLRWHVAHAAAPYLSAAFVKENFDFYSRTLMGQKEPRPRWKRCVDLTDRAIGEALGAAFVAKTFGPEGLARTNAMVKGLETALAKNIRSLDWMGSATKTKALEKLAAIENKIGHPETFRDYSSVGVKAGDLLGNVRRARAFEFARQLRKIGKPIDRKEWGMTPPTVNAGYYPLYNSITFPVGILQPPFFDLTLDDAVNYGGIGGVIGHELTHGSDDQGSQFAANGNLENWWTETDSAEFAKRTACFESQYGAYTTQDGAAKQNGKLTLGENVADNGGLRIAHMALLDSMKGKTVAPRDGFTAEQRFFLGWGQVWCSSASPEYERLQVQTDPHSLPRHRVNGTVANMKEFQKAFSCPASAPMVRGDTSCRAW